MKAIFFVIILIMVPMATSHANDPSAGWNNSMGYQDPSAVQGGFERAYLEHRLRKEGARPPVTYNTSVSTTNTATTQNCNVPGGCQNGGEATNINGYSSIAVEGMGNKVIAPIQTSDTSQRALAVPAAASVGTGTSVLNIQ